MPPCGSAARSVVLLAVASCCQPVRGQVLTYVSRDGAPAEPRVPSPQFDGLGADDAKTLRELHEATRKIVAGGDLEAYLGDIDVLQATAHGEPLSGRRAAWLYLGRLVAYPPRDVCYRVESGGRSETARTGLVEQSPCAPRAGRAAVTTIRSATLARARSAIEEARACAINTLAHEWAHAIAPRDSADMLFEDDGHDEQPAPVASYLIGSLAQCVYLAGVYRDAVFDVRRCTEAVGTNAFDQSSCEAGWGKAFAKSVASASCS